MKNGKKLLFLMFVIGFIGLFVGSFSYYRKVVSGSLVTNVGKAVFVLRDTEAGESWNNKNISLGSINPGDSGSFDVVMDASGSDVDMYATLEIERSNLPSNLKFYTTADHKSELHKYYSFLEKNGTNKESLTLYWYWNPYLDDFDDANYMNKSISANITVSAVQISEYATMKNGYSSDSSANGGTEFWSNNYKPYIRTINFGNDLSNLPSTCTEENLCWDISQSSTQKNKVYGYLVDTELKDSTDNTKPLYNLYIVSEASIFAPSNCSYIFSFYKEENNKTISNLTQINFNNNFNTSNTTNMYLMFSDCSSLTSLDLSSFNTANVTSMSYMFADCSSLTSLDLSSFNTAKVTDMYMMFNNCSFLTSLVLSNFNTANVTNMEDMFSQCSSLISLDLSNFNTANVTNMGRMFRGCSSLTSLDLSSFNTANVTSMYYMFRECSSITSLDISSFNTSNVTIMSNMFAHCSSIISLNLSSFNTASVTNMLSMFYSCSSLTNLDLTNFNTANVTSMSYMFAHCSSIISLNLSSFNTASVTDMNSMFANCRSLISLDLSSFNTSNVSDMSYMFSRCSSLTTTINIMNANVTEYSYMFDNVATASDSKITVNYIASASTLVDNMIKTKSSSSNVVKGSIIS